MRVTVIPVDHWVRRDQVSARLPDWSFDDSDIHAIQWYEIEGEIEYNAEPKPENQLFTDPAILQPYLDALDQYLNSQPEA